MRRSPRASILAIGLGVALIIAASAQSKPKRKIVLRALIAGTVFNPQSMLVRGAQITVKAADHKKTWRTATGDAGEFYLYVPPTPADYEVEARLAGYLPARSVVHVRGSEKETVFLHLQPSR